MGVFGGLLVAIKFRKMHRMKKYFASKSKNKHEHIELVPYVALNLGLLKEYNSEECFLRMVKATVKMRMSIESFIIEDPNI